MCGQIALQVKDAIFAPRHKGGEACHVGIWGRDILSRGDRAKTLCWHDLVYLRSPVQASVDERARTRQK